MDPHAQEVVYRCGADTFTLNSSNSCNAILATGRLWGPLTTHLGDCRLASLVVESRCCCWSVRTSSESVSSLDSCFDGDDNLEGIHHAPTVQMRLYDATMILHPPPPVAKDVMYSSSSDDDHQPTVTQTHTHTRPQVTITTAMLGDT